MRETPYYSVRVGKRNGRLDLAMFKRLFLAMYREFVRLDYFQEALGFHCVDDGFVPGTLGPDVPGVLLLELRRDNLWPIEDKLDEYEEDALFDMVEFLYDHVSEPIRVEGDYHSWNDCGWHYTQFDRDAGRTKFRTQFNGIAKDYDDGFELTEGGEILLLAEPGCVGLVRVPVPAGCDQDARSRVDRAIRKFYRHRSSLADRRDAIRELADVLEYLRPKLQRVLVKKDENDLFNIVNNFGIRHHNASQKTDYDKPIWYGWMFYYYLATVHAALRLIEKSEQGPSRQHP